MKFRPCIDIHDGKVKQIVGGSLKDDEGARENFIGEFRADYYAEIYKELKLSGGHIAMLNKSGSSEYEATKAEAFRALRAFPLGLQIGGGITAENAAEFLAAGASHVIVTSYVFRDGGIDFDRLKALRSAVGREHIVLDLSARRKGDKYYIVTDRWQRFTDVCLKEATFEMLCDYCDEFLIHGVDVEGKKAGIDEAVLEILSRIPYTVTYAGGISSISDILRVKELGRNRIDITIGSALNLFGGTMDILEVIECIQ